jgi:histidinol-phosphatase
MSEFLDVALHAVKEAEKIIMGYYHGDLQVETKTDASPVTIADKEAEQKIREIIREAYPSHIVYGEEGAKQIGKDDQFTWVVDPIDGTKSFIRQHGLFGTLLALFHKGEIILGVSNMPAIGELMYAEKGMGTFLNNSQVRVSDINDPSQAYMSYGSVKYFTQIGQQQNLLALAEQVKWARGIGDCWSYHLLAQGKIDIVAEGMTKIWDVAALKIIVEEAGGKMTRLDGGSVDFSLTNDIASNGHLHAGVLEAFRLP